MKADNLAKIRSDRVWLTDAAHATSRSFARSSSGRPTRRIIPSPASIEKNVLDL